MKRKPDFVQVCVWPGTVVQPNTTIEEFENWFKEEIRVRVQYLEEIITGPGQGGEGGRNDIFFAVHNEDVGKFAIPRLQFGIRWLEDIFGNDGEDIYPARIKEYYSWDELPKPCEDNHE